MYGLHWGENADLELSGVPQNCLTLKSCTLQTWKTCSDKFIVFGTQSLHLYLAPWLLFILTIQELLNTCIIYSKKLCRSVAHLFTVDRQSQSNIYNYRKKCIILRTQCNFNKPKYMEHDCWTKQSKMVCNSQLSMRWVTVCGYPTG